MSAFGGKADKTNKRIHDLALARDGMKERARHATAAAAGFRHRPALRVGDLDERIVAAFVDDPGVMKLVAADDIA